MLAGVRGIKGIVSAVPVLDGQALLTTDRGGAHGGLVRGMTLDDLRALHPVSDHIVAGKLDDFTVTMPSSSASAWRRPINSASVIR